MSRLVGTAKTAAEAEVFGTYKCKYLGSVVVKEARGGEVVVEATERVRDQGNEPRKTWLRITAEEILVLDRVTEENLNATALALTAYCGVHAKDKKLFAYTTSSSVGLLYCHVFEVKERVGDLIKDFGKTFELVSKSNLPPPLPIRSDMHWFDGFYMGCEKVEEYMGREVVQDAVTRVWAKRKKMDKKIVMEGDAVTLVITPQLVRAIGRLSGDSVTSDFIRTVSFTCKVGKEGKNEIFGYIANDVRLGVMNCHVFKLPAGTGKRITQVVQECFRVSAEQEKKVDDPFKALSDERDVPIGQLFNRQIRRGTLSATKVIGGGQFGDVYLATQTVQHPERGTITLQRAVKMLRNTASKEDKKQFMQEAEVMVALSDDSLVRMVGVAVQQPPWLVVLEFMPYGDLLRVVRTCKEKTIKLAMREQLDFARQICAGCKFIASKGYVHMDIAARNCLVGGQNTCKLADFGLTRQLDAQTKILHMTERIHLPVKWISVEGLFYHEFSEASDCWAFGVLMWEIFTMGDVPYQHVFAADVPKRVREGLRLEQPEDVPVKVWTVVAKCWEAEPKDRWLFAELE